MDRVCRLPLTHPARVRARERKLWFRELSWAIQEQIRTSKPELKVLCPCKLCDRGYRQEKYIDTVLKHLDSKKKYGRDPKNYGSSKGYSRDDSDVEWDEQILHSYGQLALDSTNNPNPPEEDEHDYTDCVIAMFQTYDELCGERHPGEYTNAEEERQHLAENDRDGDGRERHNSSRSVGDEGDCTPNTTTEEHHSETDNLESQAPLGDDVEGQTNSGSRDDFVEGGIERPGSPNMEEDNAVDDEAEDDGDSDEEDGPRWNMNEEHHVSPDEAFLRDSARTPLFHNASISCLSAVILLLNCLRMHGASLVLINEVFTLLSKVILPKPNCLPTSEYEASKMLKKLGLSYDMIDVCPNHCILFRGNQNKALDTCPECGAARRKRCGKSMVARRVLRYFPLVPRLVRTFRNPMLAAAMTYAALHKSRDTKMRSVADSEVWRFIDNRYPSFAEDPRNVRLALATDGINPFSDKRSTYSIWPVLLLNFNVAPWLTLKKFFVMLSMIIPGKKSVTGERFDMYLEPLLEELRWLWSDGVLIRDASRPYAESFHYVRAVLLFCIHDYPAYGIVSGLVTKGYKGCTCCGPNNVCRRSRCLGKNVWDNQHRMYLPQSHYLRDNEVQFRGQTEYRVAPMRMTGTETKRCGQERERWLREGGVKGSEGDPVRQHGVKRCSALFTLPYWEELPIRHTLDPMHVEKNVSQSLLGFILGEKDTAAIRRDMEEVGDPIHPGDSRDPRRQHTPELHLRPIGNSGRYLKPHPPYALSNHERGRFMNLISSIKTPTGYAGQLSKHMGQKRMGGLKSHDYHVLVQDIIPASIRRFLHPGARDVVIRVGNVFRRICAKVIDTEELDELMTYTAETLSLLEIWFPPGFFDSMPHLMVHLVQELRLAGPVHSRWCYGVERYLFTLKQSVRNRYRPEACMATGYLADEALGFVTDYTSLSPYIKRRMWDMEEDEKIYGEVLEGAERKVKLTDHERSQIHDYVICNSVPTQELRREYELLQQERTGSRRTRLPPLPTFATWLREKVQELIDSRAEMDLDLALMSSLPSVEAEEFPSMWAYGNHYRCLPDDESISNETFDSGVFVMSPQGCRASAQDHNIVHADLPYVGILKKIVQVTYHTIPRTVMKCSWIRPNLTGANPSMRQDEYGFWLAKFDSRQDEHRDNPYVFPYSVSQVFFVDDPDEEGWKVVVDNPPRSKRHAQEDDDDMRPDSAEHTFDAPGLHNPLTTGIHTETMSAADIPSSSRAGPFNGSRRESTFGETIPQAEVDGVNHRRERDNDNAAWLDVDFEDDDDNLPFNSGLGDEQDIATDTNS